MRAALPEPVRLRLKEAARLMIAALGGNADAAALIGVSAGQVSRWQGVDHPDVMPLDVAATIEMRLGRPIMTAILADLTGHELAPIGAAAAPADPTARLLALSASAAQAVATYAEAHRDGAMCPREAREMLARLDTLAATITDLQREAQGQLTPGRAGRNRGRA